MTTKNKIAWVLLWTALILWSGVKDWNAEQINHIDDTKSKVSDVLKEDPVKQLPVDLSKEIVRNWINGDTREQLLMAKLETSRENKESGEYGEFISVLKSYWEDEMEGKGFIREFNSLDENQKKFAKKLYEAWKNDPLLLKEYSNWWLALNCIWLMERVTNLKHIIRTWDLEDWKTSDLSMKLEMVLEACPSTQAVLTPTMVSKFKEIETNAVLRLQEELRITKNELAKIKNENKELDIEIAKLNALLVSSR